MENTYLLEYPLIVKLLQLWKFISRLLASAHHPNPRLVPDIL